MHKEYINPDDLSNPPGYTHVVAVTGGTTLYISGQIALDVEGQLVGEGDFRAQVEQVFRNLESALAAAGAAFTDVVKLNFYIPNYQPEHRLVIREVGSQFLSKDHRPASTLVGVVALAFDGLLLEVEAVAVIE
jgi:enamine deaminase RidA (YjgF/YER057c/UK114 family)